MLYGYSLIIFVISLKYIICVCNSLYTRLCDAMISSDTLNVGYIVCINGDDNNGDNYEDSIYWMSISVFIGFEIWLKLIALADMYVMLGAFWSVNIVLLPQNP